MTEQLKGPWKAVPTGLSRSGLPEYEIHWSDKGECVAEIVHGEEAARLIANAPEMYAMLKSCEFPFDDNHADFYCDWCHNTAKQGHRETCRLAAILEAPNDL